MTKSRLNDTRRRARSGRLTTATIASAAASLALALAPHITTAAAATFTETPVSIAATQPDDEGHAVALDGAVDVPDPTACPCPGVLINHGFEGSWHSGGDTAHALARNGYVVLRYSSRGFGNTPGEVDLIGPKEVQDALDAIHWLNNPVNPVTDHEVIHNDIGQYGASYGGGHAWALAQTRDRALKTVVPTATWSDIAGALLPNDVELLTYLNGFYATGWNPTASAVGDATASNPVQAFTSSPPDTTNNYSTNMHRWVVEANTGLNLADLRAGAAARSIAGHYDSVHIPVFIIQGTNDGLFPQNQAVAAYQALTARGVPARLYIGGIGHPPSEASETSPEALHVGAEVLAWFDHYLKGAPNGIDTAPPIEYSRAVYFNNHWDGTTRSAQTYPFGAPTRMYLCTTSASGGTLSATPCPSAQPAVAADATPAQGYNQEPISGRGIDEGVKALTGSPFDASTAPTTLTYDAPTATAALDMAGIPHLALQVAAADQLPLPGQRGFAAAFQLDPKLYDVDPSGGHPTLITRGAYAEPLDATSTPVDPRHEVDYDAFGLSYLLPAGHHLRLTLSASDVPYLRPANNPFAAVLFAGSAIDLPSAAGLH